MMRIVISLALGTIVLFAQGERGTFNGTVTDPTGAAVPQATVKAVNVATNVETTFVTNEAGIYRMPYLPPGTYRISVTAAGFKTAVRENVILAVAQTLTLDFNLEVGQVTDSVTVSSEPPLIETGTAEIGSYVTKKEFDTWPIIVGDGRRQLQQFIFTSLPGTTGSTWQGNINGSQNFSHEILIDGIPIGRMDVQGGGNNEFSPSAEAVSEFKMQTGMISAQFSGGATAVANFATKSGTNTLSGSAYYYGQNDVLRANSFANNAAGIPRQPFRQHNFGYAIGGPVYIPKVYDGRNKSFFFQNFERTMQDNFVSVGFSTLPVPDFKRGDFSRLFDRGFMGDPRAGTNFTNPLGASARFGAIYDPLSIRHGEGLRTRDPFPGNVIPAARFSPVSRNILDMVGIDDPMFDTMLMNMPNLGTCCPIFDETMLTLKGDHIFSPHHRVSATFNRNFRSRFNSPGGRWGVPPASPTGLYQWQDTPGTMARFAHDWTVTPSILNRFAIGYNRFGNLNQTYFLDQDWPARVGIENVPGTHFPALRFAGTAFQGGGVGAGGGFGSAARGGSYNGSTIIQNDTTIIRGKHNIKVGWDMRAYYFNVRNRHGSGDFGFNPLQTAHPQFTDITGHSFASFLLGAVNWTSRAVTPSNFGHRWRQHGLYFQDNWRVSRKLTLDIGLRWETIGPLFEVARRMSGFSHTALNPAAGNRPGALVFMDQLGQDSFMGRNWRQFSPKFGFAYAINDKLVFRGGYGINNTPAISNGWGFGGTLGYNGVIARNAGNVALAFPEDAVHWLHHRYPDFDGVLPNHDPSVGNWLGVSYMARDGSRMPYTQNWNFGFQYLLPASTVLEVNYIGNKGTRLLARGMDMLNNIPLDAALIHGNAILDPWRPGAGIPEPFPGFRGVNLQALRPFPQYTQVTQDFPAFGNSLYNSLQVQLTRHFSRGFSLLTAYTFSKAINNMVDDAIEAGAGVDVFNRRLERSITSWNFPHFLKVTWIYELPFGPGKFFNVNGFLGKIVGGWTFSGIHQARSGNPLPISPFRGLNPVGVSRPDLMLGQPIITNSAAEISFRGFAGGETYLNRAAFADPPVQPGGRMIIARPGTMGPLLPNIRGPMWHNHDMSIMKNFRFGENRSFELRGTFLNAINRAGRGDPITALGNPFFGQIVGAQVGPRTIEIAARITF
jgi:hypothetical protein